MGMSCFVTKSKKKDCRAIVYLQHRSHNFRGMTFDVWIIWFNVKLKANVIDIQLAQCHGGS